ncbi:FadR/GntR family transcriptional regulator [Mycobacterium vicinigordonae]|uniref:FadR family transcriptional regulator n=1 Tax=Mycobacterium vicinigordonae TaxID=1719132 RepID=A0A7D6DYN7_9MYCO|nr:GntR family transcriptional regulator [Mycobacterium vicinigordonae]QLL06949.1 FadR family transcriptional regulator [Mycobacterium vicinigordonae]
MAWRPVGAVPLSEQVHHQLLNAILEGTLHGTLPPERELAASFQVNRHVIREAVKRLQQAKLVEVNQGGATRVLSVTDHARLDLLPDVIVREGVLDPGVARAVLELRSCVGADAARLCALRSSGVAEQLMRHIPASTTSVADLEAGNLEFWSAIIDGSHNLAYRLALNTLMAVIDTIRRAAGGAQIMDALHREYRQAEQMALLATAIGDGDAQAARRIAAEFLDAVLSAPELA